MRHSKAKQHRFRAIMTVLAIFMVQAPSAYTKDDTIHRINSPPIFFDGKGGYNFIAFGDTRTADPDSTSWNAKRGPAFHTIRDWTHNEVNKLLFTEASFSMFTGDLLWRGSRREFWQEVLDLIPDRFRARNSYRFFPVLGNHELWQNEGEPDPLDFYFGAFPYLAEKHVRFHNYYFFVGESLFVNLCSGGYGTDPKASKNADRTWTCTAISSFDNLMRSLKGIYVRMSAEGHKPKNIFIQYHKPSYSTYEHPPLNSGDDPLAGLMALKRTDPSLQVFVFNGHNHVTELFNPADGVYVLVAGGGGAPQKTGVPPQDWGKPMKERFWDAVGHSRNLRFNYFRIYVDAEERIKVEEMCLYSYEDGAYLGYGRGLVIDWNGKIFFPGSGRGNADGDVIMDVIEKGYRMEKVSREAGRW